MFFTFLIVVCPVLQIPRSCTTTSSRNKKEGVVIARVSGDNKHRASHRDGNSAFNVATLALYQTSEFHKSLVDVRRKRVRWTAEEEKA